VITCQVHFMNFTESVPVHAVSTASAAPSHCAVADTGLHDDLVHHHVMQLDQIA
jgi:hypothetical protein